MRERALSALVLVPVVVVVFLLGQAALIIGITVLALVAGLEVFALLPPAGFPVRPLPGVVAPPLAVIGLAWAGLGAPVMAVFVAAVIIVAAIDGFRRPEVGDGFLSWVGTSFGALYASMLAFLAAVLVVAPAIPASAALAGWFDAGRIWLLVLVATVWSFDTCAYLAGRTLHRGRFLNHISPNKTWSGVIGGTVAAGLVAALLAWACGQSVAGGLLLGLVVAVAAQSGDVAESMLKRAAGAKDSGRLIPGHGGILDRTDSFLFAAPVMVAYLAIIGPG